MATVRDVAIIVLAIESILIGIVLIFLVFQINSLIRLLREEIKPILDSANETVSTLRGTTTFVSEKVVNPVISVTSTLSGMRQVLRLLARRPKRETREPGGNTEAS